MMRIISLGAGVQSTTLALMAAHGEIGPMPDCAIFADTQDEGAATYHHLDWLCGVLPYPVYRPTKGRLSEAMLGGDDEARIPTFIEGGGMKPRQCTRNFKIRVIRRKVRELLGVSIRAPIKPGTVESWIGISTDEADRMKPAGVNFIVNRWPLIEAKMDRAACSRWLFEHYGRRAPKSSCVYCAFQSPEQWLARKTDAPDDFEIACSVDDALRSKANISRFHRRLFLHRSCQPLRDVDFNAIVAGRSRQGDMFANECEGICGV